MTEYVVLKAEHPNPMHWEPLGNVKARSAASAIRKHVDEDEQIKGDGGGLFVAVPARSWKPVRVAVETKTSLKFS